MSVDRSAVPLAVIRGGCVAFGALSFLWPAFYNGFPLVFQDSGFYLAGLYDQVFHPGRALGYVYFVEATALGGSLWPVVATQALVTSALCLRATECLLDGESARSAGVAAAGIALAAIVGGAKYASWLMADVMAAWIFLAGLILLRSTRRLDRFASASVLVLAVSAHNTHAPLALGMVAVVAGGLLWSERRRGVGAAWRRARLVVLVGAGATLAVPLLGAAVGETTSVVRGGSSFLLYRFIDSGVAVETLDAYCGERRWISCRYRDEYARHVGRADGWFLFRRDSPFFTHLEQWDGAEQGEIVAHAFRCCWPRILTTTLVGAGRQFFAVDGADGLRPRDTNAAASFLQYGRSPELAALRASRQARGELGTPVLHPLPETELLIAALGGAFALAVASARAGNDRGRWLLGALVLFLAGNALICGFGSSLHPRYQGRIAWLVAWSVPILWAWWREGADVGDASARRGRAPAALAGLVVLAIGAAGCTREEGASTDSPPDILLIVVDTLRADRLSIYGYDRPTSPELERHLGDADRYARAYSAASFTSGSVVSMLSGLRPGAHGIRDFYVQVPDEILLLPEWLSDRGYQTAAIVSNSVLTDEAIGLAARFDYFDDFVQEREANDAFFERRARATTDAGLKWLGTERDPTRPHFLWLHYMDPHGPYDPPPDARADFERASPMGPVPVRPGTYTWLPGVEDVGEYLDRYDEEIAYADQELGRFLDAYDEAGLLDDAIVIFTSDHGETLLEDEPFFEHSPKIGPEVLRVPLLVRRPGHVGAERGEPVSLIDLVPTLLAWTATPGASDVQGVPLGERPADDVLYQESWRPTRDDGARRPIVRSAIRRDVQFRFRVTRNGRVVELGRRPVTGPPPGGELRPAWGPGAQPVRRGVIDYVRDEWRRAEAVGPLRAGDRLSAPKDAPELTDEQQRILKALGYAD